MDSLSGQMMGHCAAGTPDHLSVQIRNQQAKFLVGPVAILWDIENCPVPAEVRAEDVAGNIRVALRLHPAVRGAVNLFSAYGDFNNFPRKVREGCQRTGVNLIDVPNGKKDAADKAILVDMFLFALDNPPPSTILLISGDVDFSPALHKLGQRGYTVVLAIPSGVGVSSALCSAGRFVWDWPSVARGEGLIPAKSFYPRTPELTCYPVGYLSSEESDFLNDEEAIVYKGLSQNGFIVGTSSAEAYTVHTKHMAADFSLTSLTGPSTQSSMPSSRDASSHVLRPCSFFQNNLPITVANSTPPSYVEDATQSMMRSDINCDSCLLSSQCASHIPIAKSSYPMQSSSFLPNSLPSPVTTSSPPYVGRSTPMSVISSATSSGINSNAWVQPGDIQGLKGQIVQLINMFDGSLLLGRVPSEYHKVFGRPLYLAEYGSCKLVNLIKKMSDAICIEGKRQRKFLCLRENANAPASFRNDKLGINPCGRGTLDVILQQDHIAKTGKDKEVRSDSDVLHQEVGDYEVDVNVVGYSDEGTDDERTSDQEGRSGDYSIQTDINAEKYTSKARLQAFKEELQELLVSHACKILMSSFLTLYQQRYAKELDYIIFGAKDVEDLIKKVRDVAIIEQDQGTEQKFVVANCGS